MKIYRHFEIGTSNGNVFVAWCLLVVTRNSVGVSAVVRDCRDGVGVSAVNVKVGHRGTVVHGVVHVVVNRLW